MTLPSDRSWSGRGRRGPAGGGPGRGGAGRHRVGEVGSGTRNLPKSASKGEAQVLAMNLDTAAYGGASEVSPRGRYTLRPPAGKWALRTSIVWGQVVAATPSDNLGHVSSAQKVPRSEEHPLASSRYATRKRSPLHRPSAW